MIENNSTEHQKEQEKFYINNVAGYYDKIATYCGQLICSENAKLFSFVQTIFGGND